MVKENSDARAPGRRAIYPADPWQGGRGDLRPRVDRYRGALQSLPILGLRAIRRHPNRADRKCPCTVPVQPLAASANEFDLRLPAPQSPTDLNKSIF